VFLFNTKKLVVEIWEKYLSVWVCCKAFSQFPSMQIQKVIHLSSLWRNDKAVGPMKPTIHQFLLHICYFLLWLTSLMQGDFQFTGNRA
jgi:hypothetical protein